MATETTVDSVKMQDGRVVDFPGKKKLIKESFIAADGSCAVRLDFRNGQTRMFELPKDLILKFATHGAEQKLGDETAGVEDVDDATLAVDELIERLTNGEWSIKREASGIAGTSILLQAIVEVTGKDVAKVRAFLKDKTQAQKMALRNGAKFGAAVKRLEEDKASKRTKVDTAPLEAEIADL